MLRAQETEKHLTVPFYSFRGGCGVSLTAANVARCLAEKEHKVLLVDANLTSPGLTHLPEFSHQLESHIGIADYLTDAWETNRTPDLAQYYHPVQDSDNLTFMPAGNLRRMANFWSDAFNPQGMEKRKLFLDLKKDWEQKGFEYIIVDTPSGLNHMGITVGTRLIPDALVIFYRLGKMEHVETVRILQTSTPVLLGLSMIPRPTDATQHFVYRQTIDKLPEVLRPRTHFREDLFQFPLEPFLPLIANSKHYKSETALGQEYQRLARRLESIRN